MTSIEKALMISEFTKVWHNSTDMIKHCVGKVSEIVQISSGIVTIDKPGIDTNFCFGYRDDSAGEEYAEAENMAQHARQSTQYFIKENIESTGFTQWIEVLKDSFITLYSIPNYYGQDADCKLVTIAVCINGFWNVAFKDKSNFVEITPEDRAELIKGYEKALEKFKKRLNTYLKKYGLSKVNSWTYWADE